jgi:leader peptidase (prepilin peptidase)/N-methyltransferase
MAATIGQRLVLVPHLLMVSLTAMLVVTDFDHFRIPNRLLYPGGTLCIAALIVAALIEDQASALSRAFLGAAGYFTLLLLVYLAARGEGFGFGDVKLAILLGFFAAFFGWRVLAYSLFITSLLGGIPALILLAMGRSRKTAIPYGPPLIIGTWSAIIWAPYLLG